MPHFRLSLTKNIACNRIFDSILNGHESVAAEDENTKQVLWRYTKILAPYCDLHAGRSLFRGDPRDGRWWSHLIQKTQGQNSKVKTAVSSLSSSLCERWQMKMRWRRTWSTGRGGLEWIWKQTWIDWCFDWCKIVLSPKYDSGLGQDVSQVSLFLGSVINSNPNFEDPNNV